MSAPNHDPHAAAQAPQAGRRGVAAVEILRAAWAALLTHRLRSALTTLGILIGVASVVAVVSLIQGLSQSIASQMDDLGGNALTVRAHTDYKDMLQGKANRLRFDDVAHLRQHVPGIREVSPMLVAGGVEVRYAARAAVGQVVGATASYQDVQKRYAAAGRFLSGSDEQAGRRVAVIGAKLRESLHLPDPPLGEFVQIGPEWFRIVGVLEKRGEMFGLSQDDTVIIPFQKGRYLTGDDRQADLVITLAVADGSKVDDVRGIVTAAMRKAHRLPPGAADDFSVESADQLAKSFARISNSVTLVMGCLVGIALLVAGIGIMNVMLVSVTERTREIGICKALGARNRDVMLQFLAEATLLAALGGVAGLALGWLLGSGISLLIPDFPAAVVPWWAVVLSIAFSAGVGIVFGVMPANSAARLDPIEALRYE